MATTKQVPNVREQKNKTIKIIFGDYTDTSKFATTLMEIVTDLVNFIHDKYIDLNQVGSPKRGIWMLISTLAHRTFTV